MFPLHLEGKSTLLSKDKGTQNTMNTTNKQALPRSLVPHDHLVLSELSSCSTTARCTKHSGLPISVGLRFPMKAPVSHKTLTLTKHGCCLLVTCLCLVNVQTQPGTLKALRRTWFTPTPGSVLLEKHEQRKANHTPPLSSGWKACSLRGGCNAVRT